MKSKDKQLNTNNDPFPVTNINSALDEAFHAKGIPVLSQTSQLVPFKYSIDELKDAVRIPLSMVDDFKLASNPISQITEMSRSVLNLADGLTPNLGMAMGAISPFNIKTFHDSFDYSDKIISPIQPQSLTVKDWVVPNITRYDYPFEGQIVDTVSDVLVEIQTFRQEFLETKAEVKEVNKNMQDLIITLKEDIKKKDAMVEELLDYFRDSKSKTVKKILINYDSQMCILNIDAISIQLKPDTNQAEFCRIFFRNRRSYERIWELEDFIKDLEGYSADISDWYKKIESTVRITENEYDKYYESFRSKIAGYDAKLSMLQDAEDNYYLTTKYLLNLANRAKDLFESSKPEEKRQLLNVVLLNPSLDNEKLCYAYKKPFDILANSNDRHKWGGWIREVRTCLMERKVYAS